MYILNVIVFVLLIIGGLNWGLVGFANFNLVDRIFAHVPAIARIIYALVGLAAVYAIVFFNWYVRPVHHEELEGGHTPHAPSLR